MIYVIHAYGVFDVVSAKHEQFLSDNSVLCTVCKQEEKLVATKAHEYKIVCRNKKERILSQEDYGDLCCCSSVCCNWFLGVQFCMQKSCIYFCRRPTLNLQSTRIIKNHSLIINLRLFTGNKVASPIKVVFVKLASSTYPKT